MEANKIIIKPLLSEKSYSDIAKKKYWFVVDKNATKTQIKQAVQEIFGVEVESVNTSITAKKPKKRQGRVSGYTSENKNIYVSFKETNMFTEITIQDEGKGMSKEEKRRMFERFYKGENSSNNNFGIGMSLAKEIINKDNGKIKVDSTPGIGSTFKIRYYK